MIDVHYFMLLKLTTNVELELGLANISDNSMTSENKIIVLAKSHVFNYL